MTRTTSKTTAQTRHTRSSRAASWRHGRTALALLVGMGVSSATSAQTTTEADYVYFLDTFTASNIANVPVDVAIIGETEATGPNARSVLTAAGRIVGTLTEFNGGSTITWTPDLKALFNGAEPDLTTPAARQAFALEIFQKAGMSVDPSGNPEGGFPVAADNEWQPTAAGGYVVYTQDIERPPGGVTKETAAAITAVMWACRVNLGPNMMIVPVPASGIQKASAASVEMSTVLGGGPSDNYVKFLDLGTTLSATDQTALAANQIDLLSLLHLASVEGHVLIDGILAQQYSIHGSNMVNCAAIPGSLSEDTSIYDNTLPYAVMSAHDNPVQLCIVENPSCSTDIAPWPSHYREPMPFHSGVYFDGLVDSGTDCYSSGFNPADFLTPTSVAASNAEFCQADLNGDLHVDGADLGIMLANWGPTHPFNDSDLNDNNLVDGEDITILLGNWGQQCLESENGSSGISVLIAQTEPPADQQTYVDKIQKLAPNLEQLHLRFPAGTFDEQTNQNFADLIGLLRTAYGSTLKIGFHPNNSHSSCEFWGCTAGTCDTGDTATWHCVLDKSIQAMNAINAIVDPTHSGQGFTIFSIEQSYVEDVGTDLAAIKHCLAGDATALPDVTPASPPVQFGNVLPAYGEAGKYGADGYDYGYPQYYNLGKQLLPEYASLITDATPFFPVASAADCVGRITKAINVVDVDTVPPSYSSPKIPCFGGTKSPNIYMTDASGNPGASPELVAAYLSFLLTQYPPIAQQIDLGGAEVYITFSGEPALFGADGWTVDNINQFMTQLGSSFTYLQQNEPGLFAEGGADPSTLKYAIWNFSVILDKITVP